MKVIIKPECYINGQLLPAGVPVDVGNDFPGNFVQEVLADVAPAPVETVVTPNPEV